MAFLIDNLGGGVELAVQRGRACQPPRVNETEKAFLSYFLKKLS